MLNFSKVADPVPAKLSDSVSLLTAGYREESPRVAMERVYYRLIEPLARTGEAQQIGQILFNFLEGVRTQLDGAWEYRVFDKLYLILASSSVSLACSMARSTQVSVNFRKRL